MGRVLTHRGPDEEGVYQDGPVGLAHRRLSIIDLVSGQQPMESPGGEIRIVFNYPELKRELEQKGYEFGLGLPIVAAKVVPSSLLRKWIELDSKVEVCSAVIAVPVVVGLAYVETSFLVVLTFSAFQRVLLPF